jgi:hypothetical protein
MFGKEKKELKFRAIIELMGRPAEFLTETLNKIVESIEKNEKLKILNKSIAEPKATDEKDIFSSFIEIELEARTIEDLFEFITNYLPSNIEIISPSEINFDLREMNAVLHNVISKIHFYDSMTKKTGFENMLLRKKITELMPVPLKVEENLPAKEEEKKGDKEKSSKKKKK